MSIYKYKIQKQYNFGPLFNKVVTNLGGVRISTRFDEQVLIYIHIYIDLFESKEHTITG